MRQADRHATGPSTLSPLLAGTLALVALAAVGGRSRRAGGRGDRPLAPPPAGRSARPGARARRRPHPLAAGGHADPDRRRARVRVLAAGLSWSLAPGGRRPARIARRGCSVPAAACIRSRGGTRSATAKRFGVEQPGLPIARAIAGGQTLYATWEDMQCDIWGPAQRQDSSAARSRRCWPRPAPRSRPRTSPTCTPPPGGPRAARPGVELRPRAARRRRARLVVEPAQLRHLRPPRARADRRVRRRLPRPRRAP